MSTARRPTRMATLIHGELARVLIEDISDPTLKQVVITEVELSTDLRSARVFFSRGESNSKEVSKGLTRAEPFFKRKIGDRLQIRYVPKLEFKEDTHGDSVNRLYHLFDEIQNDKK